MPVTADEEAICLRSVSRLLSQICFLFFFSFPPLTSFAYISWRVRRGLCVLGCGRRNKLFSQRLTVAVLIRPARGEPVPSYRGCA